MNAVFVEKVAMLYFIYFILFLEWVKSKEEGIWVTQSGSPSLDSFSFWLTEIW